MSEHDVITQMQPHETTCSSRFAQVACDCRRAKPEARKHHPAQGVATSLVDGFIAGIYFEFRHGGISFSVHPSGCAEALFSGWAASQDELEELVCDALNGLGSFYEELEGTVS